ncbi:hypothetical protein [Sphaerisporangium fuscum]|uniref:hypothetical protein n=1 Tax=Sphaerisporangium fuscum TaxID=2835868 RepID=UPI001BDC3E90|nr:hypothetical protein [Sphaerisporangium fuscum]
MPSPASWRRILAALPFTPVLLAVTPVAAPAGASSPHPAAPGGRIGIGVAEIPASRVDDPRALVYIDDHVNPGTTFKRRLKVYNISPRPQHITLYAGGAAIKNHRFTFAPPSTGNELSSWITLDRTRLDLRPNSNALVRATIAVPRWATEGERYAVIWARVATRGPGPKANVALVNQVGVRTYLHVGPGGEPPTDFEISQVHPQTAPDGAPRIVATVANTGRRAIDLEGRLSLLDGPSRLNAGPFPITRGTTLAPAERGQITVALGRDLPNGPWKYRLTVQSGRVTHTATGTIDLAQKDDQPERRSMVLPLVLTGLACLTLPLLILALRRAFVSARRPGRAAGGTEQ